MGSSTTDVRRPIKEEEKKRILKLVFAHKHFSLNQIEKDSGLPSKIVEQFLQDLCYQGTLKYVLGEYQLAGTAENRIY